MQTLDLLYFFIAASGISIGLFFSIYLWQQDRMPPYANQVLGLLLFFLSLRIAKSVFYNFVELPLVVKNLGLACNLAVGPLLLLYGQRLSQREQHFSRWQWLHFVPAALYILLSPVIPNAVDNQLWYLSYTFVQIQAFTYWALSL